MLAEVVTLCDSNLRDPAATIRKIADEIDTGEYGDVACVAVVLLGRTMEVFSAGQDSGGASTAVLLQAGAQRIIGMLERYGKD